MVLTLELPLEPGVLQVIAAVQAGAQAQDPEAVGLYQMAAGNDSVA